MTLIPNETEQALNRQYDVYAAAREEYRKKIAEQAARIERLEAEAKSRTLDYLGQVEQLSEELKRLRAALRDIYMTTRCDKTAAKARAALNAWPGMKACEEDDLGPACLILPLTTQEGGDD